MKSCSRCWIIKTEEEFNKKSRSASGLRPECRDCQKHTGIQYRKRPEVKAYLKQKSRNLYNYYKVSEPDRIQRWLDKQKITRRARYKNDAAYRKRILEAVLDDYRQDPAARKRQRRERRKTSEYQIYTLPKILASNRARQTKKLKAMPKWLTPEDKWAIKQWYNAAKWLEHHVGGKWHVDHIVPLQGASVSGLHVPWNLQALPARQNLVKGNKHE